MLLGDIMEAENSCDEAIRLYQQGLETDALEEMFYRKLMRCYEKQGNHSDAVKTYLRCKETLWEQLGVATANATRKIYERIVSRP